MSNLIDRTQTHHDDLVAIARCLETIEVTGEEMGTLDESETIRAQNNTEASWADVQWARHRLEAMGVTP